MMGFLLVSGKVLFYNKINLPKSKYEYYEIEWLQP